MRQVTVAIVFGLSLASFAKDASADEAPPAETPATKAPTGEAATAEGPIREAPSAEARPLSPVKEAKEKQPAGAPDVPEPPKEAHWYEKLELSFVADGYASYNYNHPLPQTPTEITVDTNATGAHGGAAQVVTRGGNQFRAFDQTNGFALQWIGLDFAYTPAPVGGTLTMRFGPSATLLTPPADAAVGLNYVRQAFASWKPIDPLTIDLGKFDTPFGIESNDTSGNLNYTRSPMYWYAQPATHTGLRIGYDVSPEISILGLVVNGWDASIDQNSGKSFGAQITVKLNATSKVGGGYLVGPEQREEDGSTEDQRGVNRRPRHYVDVYLDAMLTPKWRVMFNLDFVTEERPPSEHSIQATWYGSGITTSYDIRSWLFGAVRASHLWDAQGFATGTGVDTKIAEGTVTAGVRISPGLLVMLDHRLDWTPERAFFQIGTDRADRTQMTTTLGFCFSTSAH